jgi:hypothetical protein
LVVERLDDEDLATIKECCQHDITRADATALEWMLRTRVYEQLNLQTDSRVLLVKYEDLVSDPVLNAGKVFKFIDVPFHEHYVAHVHHSSLRKNEPPEFSPRVAQVCENLQARMNEYYRGQNEAAAIG